MKPDQRQFLLKITAAGVAGLFLIDRVVVSPLAMRWHDQSERIATLNTKVQRGNELIRREDAIRNRWATMVRANLPEEVSAAENEAFKAIGRWARDSQITLTSLTPQWQTHDEGYKTLECRASVDGNQATIGRFIYEMEVDPAPVSLEECEMSTRDAHGAQLTLTARFSFVQLAETGRKSP